MALFLQGTKLDAKIHQKSPIISFSVAFRDIKCITSDYETIYRESKKAVRFPPWPPPHGSTGVIKCLDFHFSLKYPSYGSYGYQMY